MSDDFAKNANNIPPTPETAPNLSPTLDNAPAPNSHPQPSIIAQNANFVNPTPAQTHAQTQTATNFTPATTPLNTFHPHSPRARAARLARHLKPKPVQLLILLLAISLPVGAAALLVALRTPLAWLLLVPVPPLIMLLIYTKHELAQLLPGPTEDINDLLSAAVLARLSAHPTPTELAHIATQTNSGRFLAVRFGITPALLLQIAGQLGPDPAPIFARAREIQKRTQSLLIGGGVISAALVESLPGYEQLLHQLRLEPEDLEHGITWFNFLYGLVENSKRRPHRGGFARDMMFGYIPLLSKFGTNISKQREHALQTQMYQVSHQEIIDKMVQIFSNQGKQNVALIGPAGSGRSTIINAFAEQLLDADSKLPSHLKFRQIFMLDSAALIAATGGHGQLESLIMQLINEAYAAKNIIICLDNAQLFFEDGVGSVDISNVILPVLENGALRIILTMDQQRFLEISAKNSTLANALNKIMVSPANQEETMQVMEDQLPRLEYAHHVTYTYLALKEAYRLAERYIYDLEMPGRALNLLESSANFATHGLVTPESVQRAIEQTQGVKVQSAESTTEREKLLNLEDLIHARMIDQVDAVKTVSDALRRAAAGVRNQNRPIGTFLFLGPTGVGKTELAKALSDVYFGGESQLVRLDLNEFVNASDVGRLIADGAEDSGSLAAQVMKQPFSVVLLDEIEKAHDQVLTVLLQVLDEGILRDVKNREVSFRDAIIICTSNAGADDIRARAATGQPLAQFKEEITDNIINSGQFRPEFLNRFDEICIFQPLSKDSLMQVVDLILNSVNKSLETQKISVTLDPEAKQLLVDRGYDPRLGARPMRRVVQKSVENLVAQAVLSGAATPGSQLHLTAAQISAQLGDGHI